MSATRAGCVTPSPTWQRRWRVSPVPGGLAGQMDLFDGGPNRTLDSARDRSLNATLDRINARFGPWYRRL